MKNILLFYEDYQRFITVFITKIFIERFITVCFFKRNIIAEQLTIIPTSKVHLPNALNPISKSPSTKAIVAILDDVTNAKRIITPAVKMVRLVSIKIVPTIDAKTETKILSKVIVVKYLTSSFWGKYEDEPIKRWVPKT